MLNYYTIWFCHHKHYCQSLSLQKNKQNTFLINNTLHFCKHSSTPRQASKFLLTTLLNDSLGQFLGKNIHEVTGKYAPQKSIQIWVSVVLFKIGFDTRHWIHLHNYPYTPYLAPAIQFHVAQSGQFQSKWARKYIWLQKKTTNRSNILIKTSE